jgi:CheY-like chemotaxis protein
MSRKKVLWVDDEIEFLRSHIMFLETRGYSVTPVFSGDDAIHIIHGNPQEFDIVLLDEQMPGKDGLTTLEEIKEFVPDLPVVMVTKSEEEQVMEDALGKKIDGYLTKPVNPSQILSVCKRLLHSKQIISSQISQRFVRNYSEMRSVLHNPLSAHDWMRVYENLMRWDLELQKVEDEGIRQTQTGQKSDANELFSNFVIENYLHWINGGGEPPLFSPHVVEKYVVPPLNEGKRVYFVVFDCMRLDHFLEIEPLVKKYFDIQRNYYYSILPSATAFTRNALFAGKFPDAIAETYPDLWTAETIGGAHANQHEEELIRDNLRGHGIDLGDAMRYLTVSDRADSQDLLGELTQIRDKRFVSIVVNFADMLIQNQSASAVMQEIAPDEASFRRLTHSWFQYSNIFQALKELSRQDCTVVITTGNGSVLCTRGTEIYGDTATEMNYRYRFGEKVTCDERHALFISNPPMFKLPAPAPDANCLILKENYYFIRHDKFENYQKQYQNSFQHGGISLSEMIVPVAVLNPR